MAMPRAKRPQANLFTRTGFWLVVVLVFALAFVVALVVFGAGHSAPAPHATRL
jgi:hypothetical protein